MNSQSHKIKYRPEIDGLRALAVISVIVFHAGFEILSGGFVGVDIFFVISGYLITLIIRADIENNTFSIANFYERRIRRILPALFFVVIICFPFAWLYFLPEEYESFAKSLVAMSLFSSNILFWQESGYFAPLAEFKPLLHTWSLAVEEQFYIFFPFLLLFLKKFKVNFLLFSMFILIFISLAIAEYASHNHTTANFYLLPSRAWELGIGVILAITQLYWKRIESIIVLQLFSSVGFSMILYSVFFFDRTVPTPSTMTLIPVVGAGLIISCANQLTWVGKFLGSRVMVTIGLLSYSAYLWHQPLFVFFRIQPALSTWTITFIVSILSFLFAYLTWRFIEAPFRKKDKFSQKQMFSFAAVSSFLFIILGVLGIFFGGGFQFYHTTPAQKELLRYQSYPEGKQQYRVGTCFMEPAQTFSDFKKECFSLASVGTSNVLWGDSHAAALSFGLAKELDNFVQLTASACPSLLGYNPSHRPHCKKINDFVLKKLKELKPKRVILHSDWSSLPKKKLIKNISDTISQIKKVSPESQVFVLGGVPQWHPNLPSILIRSNISLEEEDFVFSNLYEDIHKIDSLLRDLSINHDVYFISILDSFCVEDKCLSSVKYKNFYEPFVWDHGHLTKSASLAVAKVVFQQIENIK